MNIQQFVNSMQQNVAALEKSNSQLRKNVAAIISVDDQPLVEPESDLVQGRRTQLQQMDYLEGRVQKLNASFNRLSILLNEATGAEGLPEKQEMFQVGTRSVKNYEE